MYVVVRKDGGGGLISATECVEMETRSLHGYLVESQEWMLKAAWEEKVIIIVVMTESLEECNKSLYSQRKEIGRTNLCMGCLFGT